MEEKDTDVWYLEFICIMTAEQTASSGWRPSATIPLTVAVPNIYHASSSATTLRVQFHTAPIILIKAICLHSCLPAWGRGGPLKAKGFPVVTQTPMAVPGLLPVHLLVMVAHGHSWVRAQQVLVLFPAAAHGLGDGLIWHRLRRHCCWKLMGPRVRGVKISVREKAGERWPKIYYIT